MSELLEGLNDAQREIVLHDKGPCVAAAVAGAGKTHAVVRRIAYLVKHRGVNPRRILAITYTKAGAMEMNARLQRMAIDAEVRTFHSLAYGFCRQHVPGYDTDTLDTGHRFARLIKHAISYQELKLENYGLDVSDLQLSIEVLKENLVSSKEAEERQPGSHTAAVYDKTDELHDRLADGKHVAGLTGPFFSFADLMFEMGTLLRDNAQLRATWQKKWDYVIQDEAQDQSVAQFVIGGALAMGHRNYMLVGDAAQCIYSFRGAAPHMLKEFTEDWDARVILMNENYRSTAPIIEAANKALDHVPPIDKFEGQEVVQARLDGPSKPWAIRPYATLYDEAEGVVNDIAARIKAGTRPRDIAVLYRINVQGAALEDALCRVKVPYRISGVVNLYDRAEVKSLISYLRLIVGAGTSEDLVAAARRPYRYFSKRLLGGLGNLKYDPNKSFASQLDYLGRRHKLKPNSLVKWEQFYRLLDEWREFFDEDLEADASELLDRVLEDTNYIPALRKAEGELSAVNTKEVNIARFVSLSECFSVIELLDYVEKMRKHIKLTRAAYSKVRNCVHLSSIHQSKGLEWPVVYIIGCNEGLLPFKGNEIREESRLFYVATTRARDELIYTCASASGVDRFGREAERSRFLPRREVPCDPDDLDFGAELDFGRSLM